MVLLFWWDVGESKKDFFKKCATLMGSGRREWSYTYPLEGMYVGANVYYGFRSKSYEYPFFVMVGYWNEKKSF